MTTISYSPIGIIHTPFLEQRGTPIQPRRGKGIRGTIEIYAEFADGLADLDGFSHIVVLFHMHKSEGFKLRVIPYLDDIPRGLFSTRAPRRPNPIGLSVVKLIRIDGNILYIEDVDMLDGTPLLDIKPYTPATEEISGPRLGWLENKTDRFFDSTADDRFESE